MTDGPRDDGPLQFTRVRSSVGTLPGFVIRDDGGETVSVRWADGSTTESRRDLLVTIDR